MYIAPSEMRSTVAAYGAVRLSITSVSFEVRGWANYESAVPRDKDGGAQKILAEFGVIFTDGSVPRHPGLRPGRRSRQLLGCGRNDRLVAVRDYTGRVITCCDIAYPTAQHVTTNRA